jgi:uncharacterized membrane protein YhaH (DUF805 family)
MGTTIKTLLCPACGANFPVEAGRNQYFCTFCGSRIIVNNENEFIYRHYDEAKLKEAETDRMVKMHEIEMSEKGSLFRKVLTIVWLVVSVILLFVAVSLTFIKANDENMPGWAHTLMFVMFVCAPVIAGGAYLVFKVLPEKEAVSKRLRKGGIVFPEWLEPFDERNVAAVLTALENTGFKNFTSVNLHDLKYGSPIKPGTVESIIVEGEEISFGGEIYDPESKIIVTFHGV